MLIPVKYNPLHFSAGHVLTKMSFKPVRHPDEFSFYYFFTCLLTLLITSAEYTISCQLQQNEGAPFFMALFTLHQLQTPCVSLLQLTGAIFLRGLLTSAPPVLESAAFVVLVKTLAYATENIWSEHAFLLGDRE